MWAKSAEQTVDNSPALQCWDHGNMSKPKPVKRATESSWLASTSAVRFTDCILIFASDPTDESVGYFQSSAKRTLRQKRINEIRSNHT